MRILIAILPILIMRYLRPTSREVYSSQKWMSLRLLMTYLVCFVTYNKGPWTYWASLPIGIGVVLMIWAMGENEYCISSIRLQPKQHLVGTGPYTYVRHPFYLGSILVMLSLPALLGILGYIAAIPMLWFWKERIKFEEAFLTRILWGYDKYMKEVRWRLIPWMW